MHQHIAVVALFLCMIHAQKQNPHVKKRISLEKLKSILHTADTDPDLQNVSRSELLRLLQEVDVKKTSTTSSE